MPIDATELALIVAAITIGGGIVQAFVQGGLSRSGAAIAARQEGAREAIRLCDRLAEHLTEAAQAANVYGLEISREFMVDWAARRPLIEPILTAHGRAYAALAALPADSSARAPVERALKVITELPSIGKPSEIVAAWRANSNAIPQALEAIGRERSYQYRRLEVASRFWWMRLRARRERPRPTELPKRNDTTSG